MNARRAVSMIGKIAVSIIWAGAGVVAAVGGQPLLLIPVVAYLVYLWAFNGGWLIW